MESSRIAVVALILNRRKPVDADGGHVTGEVLPSTADNCFPREMESNPMAHDELKAYFDFWNPQLSETAENLRLMTLELLVVFAG